MPSPKRWVATPSTTGRDWRACWPARSKDGLLTDVTIASSETERRAIWNIREDVWQVKNIAPLLTFDVSLPIERHEQYAHEVNEAVQAFAGPKPLLRVRSHGRWQSPPRDCRG
jgi:hypothetical protein